MRAIVLGFRQWRHSDVLETDSDAGTFQVPSQPVFEVMDAFVKLLEGHVQIMDRYRESGSQALRKQSFVLGSVFCKRRSRICVCGGPAPNADFV
jgi:hypothetical protein